MRSNSSKFDLRRHDRPSAEQATNASDVAALTAAGYRPLSMSAGTPGWAQGNFAQVSQQIQALWKAVTALQQLTDEMQSKMGEQDVVAQQQIKEVNEQAAAVKLETQILQEAQQDSLECIRAQEKMADRKELEVARVWTFKASIRVSPEQMRNILNKVIESKNPHIPADPKSGKVVTRVDSIKQNRCRVWFWGTRAAKAAHQTQLGEDKVYWANGALEREDHWQLKQIKQTIAQAKMQELEGLQFTWKRGRLVVSKGEQRGYYPLYKHKASPRGMLTVGGLIGLDDPKVIAEAVAFAFASRPCSFARRACTPTPSVSVPVSDPAQEADWLKVLTKSVREVSREIVQEIRQVNSEMETVCVRLEPACDELAEASMEVA